MVSGISISRHGSLVSGLWQGLQRTVTKVERGDLGPHTAGDRPRARSVAEVEMPAYTISPARGAHGGHPMTLIERLNEEIPKKIANNKIHNIDINKYRKNILYYGQFNYPVFSVLDSPVNYTNQTGAGLYYVESDNYFPMRGNGWDYEPMINYCLTNDLIQSSNIKYVVLSSLTIKSDHS